MWNHKLEGCNREESPIASLLNKTPDSAVVESLTGTVLSEQNVMNQNYRQKSKLFMAASEQQVHPEKTAHTNAGWNSSTPPPPPENNKKFNVALHDFWLVKPFKLEKMSQWKWQSVKFAHVAFKHIICLGPIDREKALMCHPWCHCRVSKEKCWSLDFGFRARWSKMWDEQATQRHRLRL